jgi:hypothetical protein
MRAVHQPFEVRFCFELYAERFTSELAGTKTTCDRDYESKSCFGSYNFEQLRS